MATAQMNAIGNDEFKKNLDIARGLLTHTLFYKDGNLMDQFERQKIYTPKKTREYSGASGPYKDSDLNSRFQDLLKKAGEHTNSVRKWLKEGLDGALSEASADTDTTSEEPGIPEARPHANLYGVVMDNVNPKTLFRHSAVEAKCLEAVEAMTATWLSFSEYLMKHMKYEQRAEDQEGQVVSKKSKQELRAELDFINTFALYAGSVVGLRHLGDTTVGADARGFKLQLGNNQESALPIDRFEKLFERYATKLSRSIVKESAKKTQENMGDEDLVKIVELMFKAGINLAVHESETPARGYDALMQKYGLSASIAIPGYGSIEGIRKWGDVVKSKTLVNPDIVFDIVVGNTKSKGALQSLAAMLCQYNPEHKMNPNKEVGDLPRSMLLDGFPGTGKTTMIQALINEINENLVDINAYRQSVGMRELELQVVEFDDTVFDKMVGSSEKNARERLKATKDTDKLTLVAIEDIDMIFGDRDQEGGNPAAKSVQRILMQDLEGIGSQDYGNVLYIATTNSATGTDAATRSRFGFRDTVDGPESWVDYSDLFRIKLRKLMKNNKVHVDGNGSYVPPKERGKEWVAPANLTLTEEQHQRARDLETKLGTGEEFSISWEDIGVMCMHYKLKNEKFTGRPIANIAKNIGERMLRGEKPANLFSDPKVFLAKSFEEQKQYLRDQMVDISGRQILEELKSQFDSEIKYADDAETKAADKMFKRQVAQDRAQTMYTQHRLKEGAVSLPELMDIFNSAKSALEERGIDTKELEEPLEVAVADE